MKIPCGMEDSEADWTIEGMPAAQNSSLVPKDYRDRIDQGLSMCSRVLPGNRDGPTAIPI